jgi:hypothetical protein
LEYVLPSLRQAQEGHDVQHFHEKQGADRGADERPASAAQAGPAENHSRDAGERVGAPLLRITDTDLCHEHDRSKRREERTGEITKNEDPVDFQADPARGVLVGADGSQSPTQS